jgi:hypothetical protein
MIRTASFALAALLATAAAAAAQAPTTTTPRGPATTTAPGPSRAAPYTSTPAATAPRAGGQTGAPRRRSFEACNRDALARRLRGAERRHFVSRCQLGYGRPLFRRRGPVSN